MLDWVNRLMRSSVLCDVELSKQADEVVSALQQRDIKVSSSSAGRSTFVDGAANRQLAASGQNCDSFLSWASDGQNVELLRWSSWLSDVQWTNVSSSCSLFVVVVCYGVMSVVCVYVVCSLYCAVFTTASLQALSWYIHLQRTAGATYICRYYVFRCASWSSQNLIYFALAHGLPLTPTWPILLPLGPWPAPYSRTPKTFRKFCEDASSTERQTIRITSAETLPTALWS